MGKCPSTLPSLDIHQEQASDLEYAFRELLVYFVTEVGPTYHDCAGRHNSLVDVINGEN